MHRFPRAPAVIAVIITARTLRRVHGERNATVQVLISPAGHMRVGRFAGIQLRAVPRKQRAVGRLRTTDPCTELDKDVPAVVQRALSERLHPADWNFILGRQLSSGLKMEETSLTSMNGNEETGSNNLTYPPFSRAGQS